MPDDSQPSGQIELRDEGAMIVATVPLPGCTPERALSAFTDPALLARWWRGELTAELAPGGEYSVWFAAIPARLTGRVLGYLPGSSLAFSWAWEGDDGPASSVTVTATRASASGAQLRIEHGPHEAGEAGRTAHKEHWDGWEFFLPRLSEAVVG
jgi:uncharacterized protein YndB with AHSA1/START domain